MLGGHKILIQTDALTRLYNELRRDVPDPINIRNFIINLHDLELETFCHYLAGYFGGSKN